MRRALRQFLLKVHPDFFQQDAAKRRVNEESLALLNALVDGATAEEGRPVGPLPGRVEVRMYYRGGGGGGGGKTEGEETKEPFLFRHVEQPPAQPTRQWCQEAVVRLLVAAGEMSPSDSEAWRESGQLSRSDWHVLASLDLEGLKREMGRTFQIDPPRFNKDSVRHTTPQAWAAHAAKLREDRWLSRIWAGKGVGRFALSECQGMLVQLLRQYGGDGGPLAGLDSLSVVIVPSGSAVNVEQKSLSSTGNDECLLVVREDETVEDLSLRLLNGHLKNLLDANRKKRREMVALLGAADALAGGCGLEGLRLGGSLLLQPGYARLALERVAESDLLSDLGGGCIVTLLADREERVCVESDLALGERRHPVPSVTVVVNPELLDSNRPVWRLSLSERYQLKHAHKRAAIASKVCVVTEKCRLRLEEGFYEVSLASQMLALMRLDSFLEALNAPDPDALAVSLGDGVIPKWSAGILHLPITFTEGEVARVVQSRH